MGHALIENRHGLVVQADATQATGTTERQAALAMMDRHAPGMAQGPTVGADKAYDAAHFVADLRQRRITPACRTEGPIARDRRAHHPAPGRRSARKRKLVEEAFGWAKTIAGLAKVKVRGLARVRFPFVLAMADYDLIRMPRLLAGTA